MEMPPEMRAQIEEAEAHRRLHMRDNTHALDEFLKSLDKDQLTALHMLVTTSDDKESSSYWRGQISMVLNLKYDVCPCGTDHDAELDAAFQPKDEPPTHAPNQTDTLDGRPIEDVELPGEVVDGEPTGLAEYMDLCEKYNVEPLGDPRDNAVTKVKCKGCGIENPSLDDRMLRPPGIEGCTGCQQQSAWG